MVQQVVDVLTTHDLLPPLVPRTMAEDHGIPTSEEAKALPFARHDCAEGTQEVLVAGQESKAMADQLTTVAKEKCTSRIGVLSAGDMHGVEMAIRIQLGLAA